jgi:hypothetical protein
VAASGSITAVQNNPQVPIQAVKTGGVGYYGFGPYVDNINAQYLATDQNQINNLYPTRDQYRNVHGVLSGYLRQLAQNTLIQMANEDTPLATLTLPNALALLGSQMKTSADTVQKPTISSSVTAGGSNVGNGVVAVSTTGPSGLQLDYLIGENVAVTCITDSQGAAQAGSEQFSVLGNTKEGDVLQWDYPLGSGTSLNIQAVNAALGQSTANLLNNSSFDTATVANLPDNWSINVGTSGTSIFVESSTFITGTKQLRFTANSGELTEIYQQFNQTSGGTLQNLTPSNVLCLNFWAKIDSGTTGFVVFELTDKNGTVIQNDQSSNQRLSLDVSTLTTSYAAQTVFFQTPTHLPVATAPYRLRIRMSTALNASHSLYMDHVALSDSQQLYGGGPFMSIFAGSTAFLRNDVFTAALNNKYDSKFQLLLSRLLGLPLSNPYFQIPSASSPTIPDSLIA